MKVDLREVTIRYDGPSGDVIAVDAVTVSVPAGGALAIRGSSGSGKSSLMNAIAGLQPLAGGTIDLDGSPLANLTRDQVADLRRTKVGFVFQAFNLMPGMTALENATLAAQLKGLPDAVERATAALEQVGLSHRLQHRPASLSGGEQQRVGIARVIASDPDLILADEPTGNLDNASTAVVFDLLDRLRRHSGATLIIASHDEAVRDIVDQELPMPSSIPLLDSIALLEGRRQWASPN